MSGESIMNTPASEAENNDADLGPRIRFSNGDVHKLTIRIRLLTLLPHDFEHAGNRFADIALELVDGFTLGIAARERGDLTPKATLRIFVDDNCVLLHASVFPQSTVGAAKSRPPQVGA